MEISRNVSHIIGLGRIDRILSSSEIQLSV